ncbi:hypothetical protein [Nakamurella sp. PAMC28650]|uniref:hypothetical protein n=1 Tax=Nakamurella sp. PAMC28650 TaxID=2762325 RepID=UPI001C9ABEBE|nr:hypothetical protein [Nakamurella sp. PAMC28650]
MLDEDELLDVTGVVDAATLVGGCVVGVDVADVDVCAGVVVPGAVPGWVPCVVLVVGLLVTGVNGMRLPAIDEVADEVLAALVPTGSRPGTVTRALVPPVARDVRPAPVVVADEVGVPVAWPVVLPQAASNSTAIP